MPAGPHVRIAGHTLGRANTREHADFHDFIIAAIEYPLFFGRVQGGSPDITRFSSKALVITFLTYVQDILILKLEKWYQEERIVFFFFFFLKEIF